MKIKKKLTAIISGVLCLAMLMALPFGFSGLADPNGSLNPETCTGSEFDESVYDEVTTFGTILNLSTNDYEWPSSEPFWSKAPASICPCPASRASSSPADLWLTSTSITDSVLTITPMS